MDIRVFGSSYFPRGDSYAQECLKEDMSLVIYFREEGFPDELILLRTGNRESLLRGECSDIIRC